MACGMFPRQRKPDAGFAAFAAVSLDSRRMTSVVRMMAASACSKIGNFDRIILWLDPAPFNIDYDNGGVLMPFVDHRAAQDADDAA
jgi:hypothetical protein